MNVTKISSLKHFVCPEFIFSNLQNTGHFRSASALSLRLGLLSLARFNSSKINAATRNTQPVIFTPNSESIQSRISKWIETTSLRPECDRWDLTCLKNRTEAENTPGFCSNRVNPDEPRFLQISICPSKHRVCENTLDKLNNFHLIKTFSKTEEFVMAVNLVLRLVFFNKPFLFVFNCSWTPI